MTSSSPLLLHITGASGSGTTTLGAALAHALDMTHLDTDDFYWAPAEQPFTVKRPVSERLYLMEQALSESRRCVLSGSCDGWGDELVSRFDAVIFLEVETS